MALLRLDVEARPCFGGVYEELTGEAEFAVDPEHPLNRVILDLELAPRDAHGRVHFSADVRILRPIHSAHHPRGLFLDVVNRGRSIFARMLEPGPMGPSTEVTEGFLLRRGFVVVTCGWQHDIPRGEGSFGLSAPDAIGVGAPITGAGFMALRDLISHLREAFALEFAVALGASQSGRLLRHLVYLGMCEDEAGRLALDGVLTVAAGARMTEANLRFGEPSSNGPKSAMFPFTDVEILRRATQRSKLPKIVHLNTSSEYWSSAADQHVSAALCHVSADGRSDAELPPNVRMYLCASTQHAPWPLGEPSDGRGVHPPNTIDYKPFVRAAVDNLTAWVTRGVAPPPSQYPRFSDGTLTADLHPSVDADGNELAGLRHPDVSVPLATYTGWNPARGNPQTLVRGLGSTIPFAPEVIARRYPSRDVYLEQVRRAAEMLARQRSLLAEDVEPCVAASAERWTQLPSLPPRRASDSILGRGREDRIGDDG